MTFPAAVAITWHSFTGTGIDSLGNEGESWASGAARYVIGYGEARTEKPGDFIGVGTGALATRVVADMHVYIPPGFAWTMRDRAVIGGDLYEVVGLNDSEHGFHGWAPGSTLRLKRVTG